MASNGSFASAEMVPPEFMWEWVGAPDRFLESGKSAFDYMVSRCGLTPASRVLDVGCGIGKHAIHFATFLQPPGGYDGFDVEPVGIEWCQREITSRYPHIRFQHVNVRSAMYSPGSTTEASSFRFPYEDAQFDYVFLGSVFSHMFFADFAHYVAEIVRVLKPGGMMFASCYLLNDEKRQAIANGTSAFTFAIEHEDSRIERADPPEAAVAHEEARVVAMVAEKGLLVEEVRQGTWAALNQQDQDFLFARKPR